MKTKKVELEAKILELEKKISVLEARPVCYGHYCNCNHICTLPHYTTYPPQPLWTVSSTGHINGGEFQFGNIS